MEQLVGEVGISLLRSRRSRLLRPAQPRFLGRGVRSQFPEPRIDPPRRVELPVQPAAVLRRNTGAAVQQPGPILPMNGVCWVEWYCRFPLSASIAIGIGCVAAKAHIQT